VLHRDTAVDADVPGQQVVVIESVDYSDLVLSGEGLTFEF